MHRTSIFTGLKEREIEIADGHSSFLTSYKYYVYYISISFNSLKQAASFSFRVLSESLGGG